MTRVVEISGLEALQRRFAALGAAKDLPPALRAEAEAVAAEARATLDARGKGRSALAQTIEILDVSQGDSVAFAVGTREPAGRYLEFGTARMRAAPWLGPALHARLAGIKRVVQNAIAIAGKH